MAADGTVRELISAATKLAAMRLRPLEDGLSVFCEECVRIAGRAENIPHASTCPVGRVFEAARALNGDEEEFLRAESRPAVESVTRA